MGDRRSVGTERGGRYSKEKRDSYQRSLDGHSFVAANFPGGIALYDEYDDDNFSPEVTLRYKPAHDTTIYAAYKQGFKAGGFNVSQALTPDASVEKAALAQRRLKALRPAFAPWRWTVD